LHNKIKSKLFLKTRHYVLDCWLYAFVMLHSLLITKWRR